MEESPQEQRRSIILWLAVGLAVLAIAGFGLRSLMSGPTAHRSPPKISLIPTTPPPPPPPPKEEKKPEPKDQKDDKPPPPQEQKIAPPDNPTLKMEGAAGDGPSAFGAGKVTSDDLSRLGNGGGLINPFNNYAASVKNELQRLLSRNPDLKKRIYKIEILIWVAEDGKIRNVELLGTTSDSDMDDTIRHALGRINSFSESPPPKMPQPIRLRLSSSGRA